MQVPSENGLPSDMNNTGHAGEISRNAPLTQRISSLRELRLAREILAAHEVDGTLLGAVFATTSTPLYELTPEERRAELELSRRYIRNLIELADRPFYIEWVAASDLGDAHFAHVLRRYNRIGIVKAPRSESVRFVGVVVDGPHALEDVLESMTRSSLVKLHCVLAVPRTPAECRHWADQDILWEYDFIRRTHPYLELPEVPGYYA